MEDEVSTRTIEGEACEAFDGDAHGTIFVLVVVRDIVLAMCSILGIEVILSRSEADGYCLIGRLGFHLGEHLLH